MRDSTAMSERTSDSGWSMQSEKVVMSPPQLNVKNIRNIDLTNAEEFFKLKGAVLDEHLLRLILKSFRTSAETRVQEERL